MVKNFPMNIIFWNVRALGERSKRTMVAYICQNCRAHIVCLEESKFCDSTTAIQDSLNYNKKMNFIRRDANGSSRGMSIGVNQLLFDILDHVAGIYFLTIVVKTYIV